MTAAQPVTRSDTGCTCNAKTYTTNRYDDGLQAWEPTRVCFECGSGRGVDSGTCYKTSLQKHDFGEVIPAAALLVTRSQVEAALSRVSSGDATHDDANLLRAVIQRLENQARQLAAALDKKEKDLGG